MAFNLLSAQIAEGTEVENTTTEGALASHTFAANSLQVGKVYLITGSALVVDSNSTDTLTLRLRIGASAAPASNTAVAATAAIDSADGDIAAFVAYMTVRAVGTAGSVVIHGSICQADAEAVGTTPMFGFHQVVTSLDTTAALNLQYSAEWSVAHADNEVSASSFIVAEIV